MLTAQKYTMSKTTLIILYIKNADGSYKIKSGECLRVYLTSDFFLSEADVWRGFAHYLMVQKIR